MSTLTKYRTIVVDPPWAYNDKLGSGNSGFGVKAASNGAESKYRVATVEEIGRIPVRDWADTPAHLYLWTTNAFMAEAHKLAEVWGFDQKTILTWVKHRKDQAWLGMGFYYRNVTEHVLFCVRGSLRCERKDQPNWFFGERGRHSEKPAAFYDIVESMSPGPYLDVFARKLRFNWDAWGFEVGAPEGLPDPHELAKQRDIDQAIALSDHYAFHGPGQYPGGTHRRGCPECKEETT